MKNTTYAQSPMLNPHPIGASRNGAVKSQEVYSDGLDRLWRVVAMMLNTVCIAPHRVEGKCILLRP